jgi:hypothetical protein
MKTKTALLSLGLLLLLAACTGGKANPTPAAVVSTPILSSDTPLSTMTTTPISTATRGYTSTPETLSGYPTPDPPIQATCVPHMDCLELTADVQRQDFTIHELYVGIYVLREWCNNDPRFGFLSSPCAVTISTNGREQVEIWGYPAEIGKETGADLTGRGKPDIVILDWGDGNCCASTIVYEAGDSLRRIADMGGHWVGTFADLKGDGTYEYVLPQRFWSSFDCLACEVFTKVVYEYQGNLGYVPATYRFKYLLQPDLQRDLATLSDFRKWYPDTSLVFGNTYVSDDYDRAVNSLYNAMCDYLLIGQKSDALKLLEEYYSPQRAERYLQATESYISDLLAP